MSFWVEFVAKSADDARKIVAANTQLPESVKAFATAALGGIRDGDCVSVKLLGHLGTVPNSYGSEHGSFTAEIKPLVYADAPADPVSEVVKNDAAT